MPKRLCLNCYFKTAVSFLRITNKPINDLTQLFQRYSVCSSLYSLRIFLKRTPKTQVVSHIVTIT